MIISLAAINGVAMAIKLSASSDEIEFTSSSMHDFIGTARKACLCCRGAVHQFAKDERIIQLAALDHLLTLVRPHPCSNANKVALCPNLTDIARYIGSAAWHGLDAYVLKIGTGASGEIRSTTPSINLSSINRQSQATAYG